MVYTIEQIKNWLKDHLTEERYEHSLGTAECAQELASKYSLDKEKAYFTGLIHDCAKCFSKEEMSEIIEKHISLEDSELFSPKTFHAPVGAYIAKREFGITDKEILSAIRYHTIGKQDMSDFEKVIFLADKIEKRTRPNEYAEPIRKLLNETNGLDKAIFLCYKNTIKSLVDRELNICTSTIDIYNQFLKNLDIN